MAIGGVDPYEIPKNEWQDDVDLWHGITYINLGMYLLLTPFSPYTREYLVNCKSLDYYKKNCVWMGQGSIGERFFRCESCYW